MRTFEWAIEDILVAHPSLHLGEFAAMAVLLMNRGECPCPFLVEIEGFDIAELDGEHQFILSVAWNPETASAASRVHHTKQRIPIVEGGAVAMAALLLCHFLADSDMEVTKRQQRADFLLTKLHRVVEISGTEHVREVARRSRMKRRQVLENAFGFDGYVLICCFEEAHRLIRWTYHAQPE